MTTAFNRFAAVLLNMVFEFFFWHSSISLGNHDMQKISERDSHCCSKKPVGRRIASGHFSNSAKPVYGRMHSIIYPGPVENSASLTKTCPR